MEKRSKTRKDVTCEVTSDGYTHTLSEFGTSKMIQIVLPKEYNLTLMGAYKVSGLGYDIKGSMFFIEKEGTIANY